MAPSAGWTRGSGPGPRCTGQLFEPGARGPPRGRAPRQRGWCGSRGSSCGHHRQGPSQCQSRRSRKGGWPVRSFPAGSAGAGRVPVHPAARPARNPVHASCGATSPAPRSRYGRDLSGTTSPVRVNTSSCAAQLQELCSHSRWRRRSPHPASLSRPSVGPASPASQRARTDRLARPASSAITTARVRRCCRAATSPS